MSLFSSVLVANRGEIACRVMRTAKALGYRTVAVYSDADADAPHTRMADDAVHIGASPVSESYLRAERVIAAARESGAEAIHPGYGFLSENADFAQACQQAGLVFIGPAAEAIELMGNKAAAKRRMLDAGVPCVPGYEGEDQQDDVLLAEAGKIGVPLMVKAAAGGGGRGMRLVNDLADLPTAIRLARSEAENAFGNGDLILEKAIVEPRHVEVQVFADQAGNTIHLGERDCSVQRRHQKVVEEAPCPIMTEELRQTMGEAAVAAARSINYVGAGTVEFLLDADGEFYFLEMNTRLQVEHPVTELVTGLDLVALQLQVAQGEPLALVQDDIALQGHAIEVRLYSEDPLQDFLPTSGLVEHWQAAGGEGVRVDAGICSGQEISPYYDPMVAKVIATGPNREVARRRLVRALQETSLYGVRNNKSFLIDCLQKPVFIEGAATTAFIEQEFDQQSLTERVPDFNDACIAAVLDLNAAWQQSQALSLGVASPLRGWCSAGTLASRRQFDFGGRSYDLHVTTLSGSQHPVFMLTDQAAAGENADDSVCQVELLEANGESARLRVNGARCDVRYYQHAVGDITVSNASDSTRYYDQTQLSGVVDEVSGGGQVIAPMHGLVLEVMVQAGQQVKQGQPLLVLEAMKMQHSVEAAADGIVNNVLAAAGDQVGDGQLLIEIEVTE